MCFSVVWCVYEEVWGVLKWCNFGVFRAFLKWFGVNFDKSWLLYL